MSVPPPVVAPEEAVPSSRRLLVATLVALLAAGVVLVTVVLPAEYGMDPLGTGEALGLMVLSDPGDIAVRTDGITPAPSSYRVDRKTFELAPGEAVEYKYRLSAGSTMLYSWQANYWVRSEMHSERDGAPEGTAEFFEIEESTVQRHGTYTAPFDGIHGWYWLNEGSQPVTLTLNAAGFFAQATEYPADAPAFERDITRLPGDASLE
jgi:hypothetical protein